MQQHNDLNCRL